MIDLVIVNYNSTELLHDCLASVKCSCNGSRPNVVVTDNGSKDPIEYIRKTYSDITIVRNKENIGFSRAINAILSTTEAPYIVLLNPDTIVLTDHFLESAAAFMDVHPDVGILGPGVLESDGRIQGSARSFPRFHSLFFGRRSLLTKNFSQKPPGIRQHLDQKCTQDRAIRSGLGVRCLHGDSPPGIAAGRDDG
jgi:hypothetical protein